MGVTMADDTTFRDLMKQIIDQLSGVADQVGAVRTGIGHVDSKVDNVSGKLDALAESVDDHDRTLYRGDEHDGGVVARIGRVDERSIERDRAIEERIAREAERQAAALKDAVSAQNARSKVWEDRVGIMFAVGTTAGTLVLVWMINNVLGLIK